MEHNEYTVIVKVEDEAQLRKERDDNESSVKYLVEGELGWLRESGLSAKIVGKEDLSITRASILKFLNAMLDYDREAIENLVDCRVVCNEKVAGHPSIMVSVKDGHYEVGLLGVLNGLLGPDCTPLGAQYDDNKLTRFVYLGEKEA